MKKMLFLAMALMMFLISPFSVQAEEKADPEFKAFHLVFIRAFESQDNDLIFALMSKDFQWADDKKKISRKAAFQKMGEKKLWIKFHEALKKKPVHFIDSTCPGGCYSVWEGNIGFIFKKAEGLQYKFAEIRAN